MQSAAPLSPVNFSQTNLLAKIRMYLAARFPAPTPEQSVLIRRLNEGYCSGLTALTLSALWMKTQPYDDIDALIPREDINWLVRIETNLDRWQGDITQFSADDLYEIDRFIQLINRYQNIQDYEAGVGQGDLDVMLKSHAGNNPTREYSIAGCLTMRQFLQKFKVNTGGTEQETSLIQVLAPSGRMVIITSPNHDTGIFHCNDIYYYYDSNNPAGVIPVSKDHLEKLIQEIFTAHRYSPDVPSPFGIRVFGFAEDRPIYPDRKLLLKMLDVKSAPPVRDYANGMNSIYIAGSIGCKESFEYFLQQYNTPTEALRLTNAEAASALQVAAFHNRFNLLQSLKFHRRALYSTNPVTGESVIHFAAKIGFCSLLRELVRLGANVNAKSIYGLTPLLLAAQANQSPAVRTLLELGANANGDGGMENSSALHYAAFHDNLQMTKDLLAAGAHPGKVNAWRLTPADLTTDPEIQALLLKATIERKFDRSATTLPIQYKAFDATLFHKRETPPSVADGIKSAAETANKRFRSDKLS